MGTASNTFWATLVCSWSKTSCRAVDIVIDSSSSGKQSESRGSGSLAFPRRIHAHDFTVTIIIIVIVIKQARQRWVGFAVEHEAFFFEGQNVLLLFKHETRAERRTRKRS